MSFNENKILNLNVVKCIHLLLYPVVLIKKSFRNVGSLFFLFSPKIATVLLCTLRTYHEMNLGLNCEVTFHLCVRYTSLVPAVPGSFPADRQTTSVRARACECVTLFRGCLFCPMGPFLFFPNPIPHRLDVCSLLGFDN